MAAGSIIKNMFDLEGGCITKSPCRDCTLESNLPGCSNDCRMLSQVQMHLARSIFCSNQFSEYEEYSLLR